MSLIDISLELSYESGRNDLVNEFYVPSLSQAVKYDRIAGYFSSTSLAVAARGIAGLINNKGKMRLIASPYLSDADVKIINEYNTSPEIFIENKYINEFDNIENGFERSHLEALGWMLANNFLEIKLAYVIENDVLKESSLFHQKVGILEDINGDKLSFSGSINETASAWINNVEEFKVFRSWNKEQEQYLIADTDKFICLWENRKKNVKVINLPDAIRNNIIKVSKDFNYDSFITKQYIHNRSIDTIEERLSLFSFQKEAVRCWEKNNYKLLFEMATGTGKTRTAIACLYKVLMIEKSSIIIISCPQSTLSRQWKTEIEKLGLPIDYSIIVDSSNHGWRSDLEEQIIRVSVGYNNSLIIYTTHKSGSSPDFINIIEKNKKNVPITYIGDEVHALGAQNMKLGLLDIYQYRIGLSATPQRWFDDYGTSIIKEYFGDNSFRFTIGDALNTVNPLTNKPFLVNFEYHPVFISLDSDEFDEYIKLTTRIKKLFNISRQQNEFQTLFDNLQYKRANIIKNAKNKMIELDKIIISNLLNRDTLIFTSDQQIDKTMQLLSSRGVVSHRFTQSQGTIPDRKFGGISEREFLINKFRQGFYQALVAIKCLDEGIDIPSATTAIIMSSSTNPREYIQRVGRVIRQSVGKVRAYIYDFVIEPDFARIIDPDMAEFERIIFKKELNRVNDMSLYAINNVDVLLEVNKRIRRLELWH